MLRKILCVLLFAISSLGQKYGPRYTDDYKDIEKEIRYEDGKSALDIYGEVPNTFVDIGPKEDVILDKKYINLFNSTLEGYNNKGKYNYYTDDGNPDIHGTIERPCQAYDTFCIRKFFAEHSHCKISGRAVPDPLFRAQVNVNYPHSNMSASQVNSEYRGLSNARVEEFYINKNTDNLVISLDFPSVSIYGNETSLKFYLRGREPVLTRDFGGLNTLSYSITAVIPNLKKLRLDKAEITTYMNLPVSPYVAGPGLLASTDPEVLSMVVAFFENASLDQAESALTESFFYAATYIQYNICDFGLKVL